MFEFNDGRLIYCIGLIIDSLVYLLKLKIGIIYLNYFVDKIFYVFIYVFYSLIF